MTKLSNVFVRGNTLANTSVQQLSEALTNEAGAAISKFNISLEDGVAVLASFADQGIKGNVAGSLFGRGVRLITKAALENKAAFKKMGIEVFNAQGEFNSFADIAQDMERALGTLSTTQRAVALSTLGFEARMQQAILPLIGASDNIRRYRKELESAAGTTDQVVNNQLKSIGVQLKLLKNTFTALSIEIASTFAPEIRYLTSLLKDMIESFRKLSPITKKIVGIFTIIGAALGPVTLAIAGLQYSLSLLIPYLSPILNFVVKIGDSLKVLFSSQFITIIKSFGGFLATIGSSLGVLAVHAVGLLGVFKILTGFFKQIYERLNLATLFSDLSGVFDILKEKVISLIPNLAPLLSFLKEIPMLSENAGRALAESLLFSGTVFVKLISDLYKNFRDLFNWLSSNWAKLWSNAISISFAFAKDIGAIYARLGKEIIKAISGGGFDFKNLLDGMTDNLNKALKNAKVTELKITGFDGVREEVNRFDNEMGKILKNVDNNLKKAAESTGQIFRSTERPEQFTRNIGDLIRDAVEQTSAMTQIEDKVTPKVGKVGFSEAILSGTVEAQKAAIGQTVDVNKKTAVNTEKIANNTSKQLEESRKTNAAISGLTVRDF